MGSLKPSDVIEKDISEMDIYCTSKDFKVSDIDVLTKVCEYILNSIDDKKLSINMTDTIDSLPKNTSAGFPEYGKKGDDSSVKNAIERVKKVFTFDHPFDIYTYLIEYPVTIFHRFTPKMKLDGDTFNPNFKIRQILCQPFFLVVIEKMMFFNFVESFKRSFSQFYCIGLTKDQLSFKISKLRKHARLDSKVILCGDINGCDKSISTQHSLIYFSIASNFVNKVFINVFEAYVTYFLRTPMIYAEGLRYSNGSTITGSWITSSFTTLSVLVPLIYSYYKIYKKFPSENDLLLQGDDFVICLDKEMDKVLFKEYLLEFNLRLRLDISKVVYWFEDIEFLGFFWNVNNSPDQTDEWIIAKILYPEKYMRFEGPLRIIFRIISIIINLKRFNSLFYAFYLHDKELRKRYDNNQLSKVILISEANEILKIKIPINEMLKLGWRML